MIYIKTNIEYCHINGQVLHQHNKIHRECTQNGRLVKSRIIHLILVILNQKMYDIISHELRKITFVIFIH